MSYILGDGLDYLESLPDRSIDGIFTDPPWGSGPDIVGQADWLSLIDRMAAAARRVVKEGKPILCWMGVYQMAKVVTVLGRHLEYQNLILVVYTPSKYIVSWEVAGDCVLVYRPTKRIAHPYRKFCASRYLVRSTGKSDTKHPCGRNVRNVGEIISNYWGPSERIVDPFAGSNTTGVAGARLGVNVTSYEIDPKMYHTGVRRMDDEQPWLFPHDPADLTEAKERRKVVP